MNMEQNKGTTVSATKYEAKSETTPANAKGVNKNLLTPYNMVTGKKTTTVVKVAASTGSATSRPPVSAAAGSGSPSSMCRKIFSRTTTELSMRRDSASAKPPRTMLFTEFPVSCRTMKVASTESGMEKETATVARK